MTNRDFDADDADYLLKFASLEEAGFDDKWEPWDLGAPMWQRHALIDAVREKGLRYEYEEKLIEVLDEPTWWNIQSAPPEAMCSAILQLEGD